MKIVPQLDCFSQDSDALVSQRSKQFPWNPCKKFWDQFKKYGSLSLHHVKHVSGKRKDIAWKNTSQTSTSAKSLRYENWGPVPWRDWKTRAMCPKQGMEPCQTYIQAQTERQNCILLSRGGLGTPGCVNKKEPEERAFVVDSGASMHMVSKRDLNSAELETMRTSRSPKTVMTANSATPTPTLSPSLSQDSVFDERSRYTKNPVSERSGSASGELRGNLQHKPTETENKNKNEGREELQSDLFHDMLDCFQDFRENLVGESSPTKPRGNPPH